MEKWLAMCTRQTPLGFIGTAAAWQSVTRSVVLILGALVSAAAAAALGAQAEEPLSVAYMASDGELVPVARYDGTGWRNTWPEPIERDAPLPVRTVSEIPRAWLGQPVPLTWMAWSEATGKHQRVTVTGVDRDGACVEAITLATSFRPDPPSDGLAFDRPTTVDAILQLEQSSSEWDALGRGIAPHFQTAVATVATPRAGPEGKVEARVLVLARANKSPLNVVVQSAFRDPRSPCFSSRQSASLPGFQPTRTRMRFRMAAGSRGTAPVR